MQKLALFVIGFAVAVAAAAPREDEPSAREDRPQRSSGGATRVERSEDGHFYVDATVNDQSVRFLVDTGATSVALTTADAGRIGVEFDQENFRVVGSGASGPVQGQRILLDSVEVDGKAASDVRGVVLEGLGVSLLGQAYLAELEKVEISGDEMVLR
jgi:aspartyl protease family protein